MARNRSWNVAAVILGIALLLPLGCCKKSDEVTPPQTVTFTISVYNHVKAGVQRTVTKSGYVNNTISLAFADVAIDGVSQRYMVAREPNIGKRLGYTTSGFLDIQTTASTNIDVYLFDMNGSQESYLQDIMNLYPEFYMGRHSKWYRRNFDGRTPNNEFQSNFEVVFYDLNTALATPFIVGSCSAYGGVPGTDFSYGCKDLQADGDKYYEQKWVCVDNESMYNIPERIQRTMLAEIWEALPKINNIGGNPSQMLICDSGGCRLNAIGANLLRFAFLMAVEKNQ
jgi:hypothetical protein